MSDTIDPVDSAIARDRKPMKVGAACLLSLAATPTFALMALLTSVFGTAPTDILCSAMHAAPLGGMVPMYVLMSAFHSAPWLKLLAAGKS
jgi:hypothetical protein